MAKAQQEKIQILQDTLNKPPVDALSREDSIVEGPRLSLAFCTGDQTPRLARL